MGNAIRPVTLSDNITSQFDLQINCVEFSDALSSPFIATVTLVSPSQESDFSSLLGQAMTLTCQVGLEKKKFINGIITQFRYLKHQGRFYYYEAIVEPTLALLRHQSDCRIFQNLSVPEIVNTLLKEHGFFAEEYLVETYPKRVYCVQYRESQFDFIQRLLDQEGIYYSFIHSDGQHQMVLYDHHVNNEVLPAHSELRYDPFGSETPQPTYRVHAWHPTLSLQTGAAVLANYNYKQARPLKNTRRMERPFEHQHYEDYDYPGPEQFTDDAQGERYTRLRVEAAQCQVSRIQAETNSPGIETGYKMALAEHPNAAQNQNYLILSHQLSIRVSGLESGDGEGQTDIHNRVELLPENEQYRPPQHIPRPVVDGPQTAVVVGPAAEEIYTDEFGRVKCQFHWDRKGENNENSSCWIRVSQNWGGAGWGHIATPRIGQEVIVDFLEGNPDQPIIVGRTYNGSQRPPYSLPDHKTRMSIKSKTYKGEGFNELRFEDKPNEEEVFIHAQKDQNNVVLNNETTEVGVDRSENIGNNETITIGTDRTENVGNNETITIGTDRTEKVGSNETITIGGNRTETVQKNELHTIAITRTHNVGVNDMLNVGGANEVSVGGFRMINVGLYQNRNTGMNLTENVGKNHSHTVRNDHTVKIGDNFVLDAGDQITLKTGKSSLVMKKDGTIVLKGKDIKVNGSGKIDMKAKKNFVQKGKKILEN